MKKKGGKSDLKHDLDQKLLAAVIVCSDSISAWKKEDRASKVIKEKLEKLRVEVPVFIIIPDEIEEIKGACLKYVNENLDLIIFTGGTSLSPRDVTPEALGKILERRIPGIEEAIRSYGQQRTPYSMLSRSIAGLISDTVVLGLPGSTNGASESMDAVFPALLHVFKVMEGARHD